MTGSGVYLLAINLLLQVLSLFGFSVDVLPGDTEKWADALSIVVGMVLALVGQLRRPDLVGGIVRRK